MAMTRLRWHFDALRLHVQRQGNACDEAGMALRVALIEEASEALYERGVANLERVEEVAGLGVQTKIQGGVVWIAIPDLMEGEGGLVYEWVDLSCA